MATPTEAEIQDQIRRIVKILNEARKFGDVNAVVNWVALEDALVQALETDYASDALAALVGGRSRLASILGTDAGAMIAPLIFTYGQFLGVPEVDVLGIFTRIYDSFADSLKRVTSRQFTFGAPAAGVNLGDGVIQRLNTDERGFAIESQFADAKTAKCVQDQSTGVARHEEVFEFRGQDAGRDAVQLKGSGLLANIPALSARQSLLANPSFSGDAASATPTAITSWTATPGPISGANFEIISVDSYRNFQGDVSPSQSLVIKTTQLLEQGIEVNGLTLNPAVPYNLQVAWRRDSPTRVAATGTLTIRLGTSTTVVAVLAQVGWQVARIAVGTGNWYRNFKEEALDVEIDWVRTAGELVVDDVLLVPATAFDNSWYWVYGARTPFLRDDIFTWADTEVGSILQYWFWRTFGRYLPHAVGGAVTWAEP